MPETFAGRGFYIVQYRSVNKADGNTTFEKTQQEIVLANDISQAVKYVTSQLESRDGIVDFEIIGVVLNQTGQEVMIAGDTPEDFLGDW